MKKSTPFLDSFIDRCQNIYLRYAPGELTCCGYERSVEHNWINLTYGLAHQRGMDDVFIRLDKNRLTVDILPGNKTESIYLVEEQSGRWISLLEEERSDAKIQKFELLPNCPPLSLDKKERTSTEEYARDLYALAQSKKDLLKILLTKPVVDLRLKK